MLHISRVLSPSWMRYWIPCIAPKCSYLALAVPLMMYGFGDDPEVGEALSLAWQYRDGTPLSWLQASDFIMIDLSATFQPLPETVDLVEEIVVDYVTGMVSIIHGFAEMRKGRCF